VTFVSVRHGAWSGGVPHIHREPGRKQALRVAPACAIKARIQAGNQRRDLIVTCQNRRASS
jgi:hypothetical protein